MHMARASTMTAASLMRRLTASASQVTKGLYGLNREWLMLRQAPLLVSRLSRVPGVAPSAAFSNDASALIIAVEFPLNFASTARSENSPNASSRRRGRLASM